MNDALTEKVEQLLTRYAESRHIIASLEHQIQGLTSERIVLESRLREASFRIDALLKHLSTHLEPNNSIPAVEQVSDLTTVS